MMTMHTIIIIVSHYCRHHKCHCPPPLPPPHHHHQVCPEDPAEANFNKILPGDQSHYCSARAPCIIMQTDTT